MSLQFLHESIIKALEAEATRLANQAIAMRANIGTPADEYAMVQCQTLATAYGLTAAMQIVTKQYRLMVDPPQEAPADEQPADQPKRRPYYG